MKLTIKPLGNIFVFFPQPPFPSKSKMILRLDPPIGSGWMDLNLFFVFFFVAVSAFFGDQQKKPPVSESTGKAHCLLTPKIWDYCLLFREETEINNPPCVHLRNLQIFSEEGSSGRSHQLSPLREGNSVMSIFVLFETVFWRKGRGTMWC